MEQEPCENPELLRQMYHDEGMSLSDIAEHSKYARRTVQRRMKKHGIERRHQEKYEELRNAEKMYKWYVESGMSTTEIANKLGCNSGTVYQNLKSHGIEMRDKIEYAELHDKEWLKERYKDERMSTSEIAEEVGCNPTTVLDALNKFGIKTRPAKTPSGERHPRWEGGVRFTRGSDWLESREKAKERDGYECTVCGMSNEEHKEEYGCALHVHHIRPQSSFEHPNDAHNLKNLTTVCYGCHRRWEGVPVFPATARLQDV